MILILSIELTSTRNRHQALCDTNILSINIPSFDVFEKIVETEMIVAVMFKCQ